MQTFRKRPGTTNKGSDYEHLNIADIVLRLVNDESISNFFISSNDEDFGAFDDIVVEIELENSKEIYALQLKHNDRRNLSLESLKNKNGDFSLKKYVKKLPKIPSKCLLLTNLKFNFEDHTRFQLEDEDFYIELFKIYPGGWEVSEKTNYCYVFRIVDDHKYVGCEKVEEYKAFFKNFFLYVDQDDLGSLKTRTRNKFTTIFTADYTEFDKYTKFITEWSMFDGVKEKLDKMWMQRAIAFLLLSSRMEPLAFNSSVNEQMEILRNAISTFDLTALEQKSYPNVNMLWSDTKNELTDIDEINKLRRKYQICLTYIDSLENIDALTWSKLLWLSDKCPLIVNEDETVHKVIELCSKNRIILLGSGSSRKLSTNKLIFRNLADLHMEPNIYAKIITDFTYVVQGKQEISLKHLLGDNNVFLNIVKIDHLLEMLDGPLKIGGKKERFLFPYIERTFLKPVINIDYLQKVGGNSLVIVYCVNDTDKFSLIWNRHAIIDHCFSNLGITPDAGVLKCNIYTTKNDYCYDYCKKLCDDIKWTGTCQQFRFRNDGNLEWIQSSAKISDLEDFKMLEKISVKEEKMWYSKPENNINVIIGDPGTGKSELMKSFKNNCPDEFWTVLILPEDIFAFCQNLHDETNILSVFGKFILEEKYKSLSNMEKNIFKIKMKNENVFFVWDALDEIPRENLDMVIKIILQISEKGIVQWITSRCHLKKYLEGALNVLSMNISDFKEEEQNLYIKKRLNKEDVEEFTTKVKATFVGVQHRSVLGVPQQIFMLTKYFLENREKYSRFLNNTLALTDLYDFFIKEKFNLYYKKQSDETFSPEIQKVINLSTLKALECYESLAFKVLLSEEHLKQLNLNIEENLRTIQEFNVPVGLIEDCAIGVPQFLDDSFAEYLVSSYFSKHFSHKNVISDVIFREKHVNIRFFFDLLLANQSIPHIAVLYKNYGLLQECQNDIAQTKDKGGRNALHLACSWGRRYPGLGVEKNNGTHVIDDSNDLDVTKEESRYLEMVEYLTNRCDLFEDTLFDMTPFMYARKSECLILACKILKKCNRPVLETFDELAAVNILYYTAMFGYDDAIDLFTSDSLPFIETKKNKSSLLHVSIYHERYLRKLLQCRKYKENINTKDKHGRTPFYVASDNKLETVRQFLCDCGAL